MADLWDAVTWTNLQGLDGAKAGYIDGPKSVWPPEAWTALAPGPFVRVSVFANITADAFDVEDGNASPGAVMAAIAGRAASGKCSWVYFGQDSSPAVYAAAKAKGVPLLDRSLWPRPGCYVWASDPSGNIAAGRWRLPVDPVAVQDGFYGTHDHSTLYVPLDGATGPSGGSTGSQTGTIALPVEVRDMIATTDKAGNPRVVGIATDNGDLLVFTETEPGSWSVMDVTQEVHNANPADVRLYKVE